MATGSEVGTYRIRAHAEGCRRLAFDEDQAQPAQRRGRRTATDRNRGAIPVGPPKQPRPSTGSLFPDAHAHRLGSLD